MELRQAVQQALQRQNGMRPATPVVAAEEDEEIGELKVAEYIIYVLALDTYIRYVEEATKQDDPMDEVIVKGVRLLRVAEAEMDSIKGFLDSQLPSASHKKMLAKYLAIRAVSSKGAGLRAFGLRTVLTRGGPGTMRGVFENNKAIRQVREAISACTVDDADAALDLFAKIPLRNARLRAWIELAAQTAVSGALPANVVEAGAKEAQDQKAEILTQGIQQLAATGAEASKQAQEAQTEKLVQVQQEAEAAARKAMEQAGEPDEPLTKSETVGVAVAAAVAAISDPSNPQNVPDPLRKLDDEQRAAALTDGRVLVAAGAGAGKSTTLVSRVTYLVTDRRVLPSRILATSFNTKAANELKEKIGRSAGGEALQQMSVGTMHSLFRRFIGEYGTAAERTAMGLTRGGANGFIQGGSSVARTVQKMWAECYPPKDRPTPKLKNMLQYKSQWSGNNITPDQARANASKREELDGADWYELYEGLKGSIPGWTPPCEEKAKDAAESEYREKYDAWRRRGGRGEPPKKRGTTFETFLARFRPGDERLGDFDDMLSIFRDILKREEGVRKAVQKMYDHIMVDECQDLNTVQHDIIEMMSEHISDGSDGKSLWMVGDDKQSIYGFRGARPDLFTGLHGKEGWQTRMIKTNYRCEPEIVDAANKLIGHNSGQIPMEARPSPAKSKGVGSIRVETPEDEADAALTAVEEIKRNLEVPGANVSDFAVLCRTNAELNSYETACIIRGIPYARKGASSFLGSPETKAFLSYVQLATGDDFSKMQKSLGEVINRPNRFFLSPDAAVQAVEEALSEYARKTGQSLKNVNPMAALRTSEFVDLLAFKVTKVRSGFKFDKAIERIEEMAQGIDTMQANSSQPGYTTKDMFEEILTMRGQASAVDPNTGRSIFVEQTFRESLQVELRDSSGEDDDADDEEEDSTKGLGNISFLFKLAEVDPTDPMDIEQSPGMPNGFKAKMERYANKARDLRIDLTKWDKEQQALPPERRAPPPGVYLGTVHSVKGAQWPTTFVQMPKGKFPFEPKPKPGEPPPDPEELQEQLEGERRLAYVALTRAAKNLTVICPSSVGGKAAGVSPFVDEADLTLGENVAKAGTPAAAVAEAEAVLKKEASLGPDEGPDEWDHQVPWNSGVQ